MKSTGDTGRLAEIARLLEIRERCARLAYRGAGPADVLDDLAVWTAQRLRALVPQAGVEQ